MRRPPGGRHTFLPIRPSPAPSIPTRRLRSYLDAVLPALSDEHVLQFVVDALHAARHPADEGLGRRHHRQSRGGSSLHLGWRETEPTTCKHAAQRHALVSQPETLKVYHVIKTNPASAVQWTLPARLRGIELWPIQFGEILHGQSCVF